MSVKNIALPAWLERGVADLFPVGTSEELDKNLALRIADFSTKGKPLRVKLGIDPT